nr:hypothetical protein [Candidatus Levybacteria bacterium]
MNLRIRKKVFLLLVLLISFLFFNKKFVYSQNDCTSEEDCVNKISILKSQNKTYASDIQILESQIKLTLYRITATQEQITSLALDIDTASKKVASLQKSLDDSINVLLIRIVATYEVGTIQPLQILLTSGSAPDFLQRLNYLRLAQAHDKKLIYDMQQAKTDYANQKIIFQDKKKQIEVLNKQLQAYKDQLAQQQKAKQQLIQTNETQISQYEAQLSALRSFSKARVGAGGGIIPHQDLSDSWGKYYNQRDSNWGNNPIGLSSEQIWSVGCLLTDYAMIVSHFGGSIIPADVAANTSNFFGNTAYFLKPGSSANGHAAEVKDNPPLQDLRDALNSGAVVMAGLSSDGGPYPAHYSDHWVVLRSVDGDSFRINDPWYQGAMNVSLNDHYSGWTIIEARIYR